MEKRSIHVGVNARAFVVKNPGGDVQSGIRLVRALSDRKDIRVTLFGHEAVKDIINGVPVVSTGFPFDSQAYGVGWESTLLPQLAVQSDVDVLFCPNGNAPIRPSPVPVATWIHDIFAYKGDAGRTYGRVQQFRVPRIIRYSDAITTVSEFSKSELKETFDLKPDDVAVVYNGVDPLFRDDNPGEPVSTPDPYLLFVGGLNERKNFSGLLDAVDRLRQEYDVPHELIVVGPTDKAVYATVKERLSRSGVTHLGFISEPELKYLYTNADAFLFPSLLEGFGIPPLEAMACGTPVISSNRPCMPEVLDEAAAFVDPTNPQAFAETIYKVVSDEAYARRLRSAGKDHAAKFTWDRAAAATRQVLAEVSDAD